MTQQKYELKPLFVERMQNLLGKDFENYLKTFKKTPLKSIRVNTLKISPEKLRQRLNAKDWKIKQPFRDFPEIMVVEGKLPVHQNSQIDGNNNKPKIKTLTNSQQSALTKSGAKSSILSASAQSKIIPLEPGELGRTLEHLLGYYYVQDISSMLPVIALQPQRHEKVLDLCASPGSKTTQIASHMTNTGTIIANEPSLGRIKILASNLEKCGVANVILTKKEGISLCKRFKEQGILFDKILVDAPCSGEGTMISKPKTIKMWNIRTVLTLSKLQKSLLSSVIEILKPGGTIIYSTCTHSPEENERVIDYILRNHPNIKIEKIEFPKELKSRQGLQNWRDESYLPELKYSCRIYPQDNGTEGFFIAKLIKIK